MKDFALSPQLNRRNNFDFLRFFFAVSVVLDHFFILTKGYGNKFWPVSSSKAVAGFFIISGFLITWSYCNNDHIGNYFKKRAKRIIPAYYTVVVFCAFFLCFISAVPFIEYFHSTWFFKYLAANLSFLNFVQPELPGVFSGNLLHAVNGSLWTIKVEIALYCCVPVYCFFAGKTNKEINKVILFLSIYLFSIVFSGICSFLFEKTGDQLYSIMGRQFVGQLRFFISGALILFCFDRFKKHIQSLVCIAMVVLGLYFVPVTFPGFIDFVINLLFPVSFAILIIGFAFSFKFLNNFGKYGDFSYGIYLIHFPVIQTLLHFRMHEWNFLLTLITSLVITIVLAGFSWHVVEKHFLKRR
jgi:peptidoglycan/LPS O-acetylase OafA/YrhL